MSDSDRVQDALDLIDGVMEDYGLRESQKISTLMDAVNAEFGDGSDGDDDSDDED